MECAPPQEMQRPRASGVLGRRVWRWSPPCTHRLREHVRHPILHLEVLAADGTLASDHVVFCRLQQQSVRVEDCCRCARCDLIEDGPAPAVTCTLPAEPLAPGQDPEGQTTEVGAMLSRGTVVIADSVPIRRALDLLRDTDRRSVAVVDVRHVMVGLVHEACFVARLATRLPEGSVSASMSSPVAVDERTPVRTALKLLAANHLREATVVSNGRVPIGVFRDVDGLRWIAAARRSAAAPKVARDTSDE
jgi:CBS domain-containing protein